MAGMELENVFLMNKNREVAKLSGTLSFDGKNRGLPVIRADSIEVLDDRFAPVCLVYLGENTKSQTDAFNKWYEKRTISANRPDVPLNDRKLVRWIDVTQKWPNMFSLTDQYWFRFKDQECWEKLNFFTNGYNDIMGTYFLSKNQNQTLESKYVYNSPELTTNGIQPKQWVREADGEDYLYKYIYKRGDVSPLCEVIASRYLKQMNMIRHVEYELTARNYSLCSRCKNFINEHQEFVPASHVIRAVEKIDAQEDSYDRLIRACDSLHIPDVVIFIDNMIMADRAMMNFDRHLGNFGFIRNVDTGDFEGPAPLFDFGRAYFPEGEQMRQKLKEHKQTHLFSNREKKLIREGKILPSSLPEEIGEIGTLPMELLEFVRHLEENIIQNNEYIEMIASENKEKQQQKNKRKGGKKERKEVPQADIDNLFGML